MTAPRVLIATTMSAAGYAQHGDKMLATAGKYWAPDVRLRVYAEGFTPEGRHSHVEWCDLHQDAPWLAGFKALCEADPLRCGAWGGGYDFRMDARKFAHKVAAMTAAGLGIVTRSHLPELFCWLDADTVTHAPVSADFLCDMVPRGALLGWLDRAKLYPECGYLAFRPDHLDFRPLMQAFRDLYEREGVFRLREWHDSYALQQLVRPLEDRGVRIVSLSGPEGRRHSHPFINSALSQCFDHCKGPKRKALGRTPQGERVILQDGNPYWTKQ